MSIVSVPLEEFQASNQAFRGEAGPWLGTVERGRGEGECSSQKDDWCDGYCLTCAVFPVESLSEYHTKISTNISIRMDQYGGANKLDFNWNFWPLFCGNNTEAGNTFPLHTQIGDAGYDYDLPAVDWGRFFASGSGHPWEPSPKITHTGSTTVPRSADGNLGYIPITITFTIKPETNREFLNYYIKGIGFQITTPISSAVPATPPTASSSSQSSSSLSSSSSSRTSNTLLSTQLSLPPLNSVTWTDSASPPTSTVELESSSRQVLVTSISAPVIVGATMGSIALVAVFLIGLFFWMKRRKKATTPLTVNPYEITMHPIEKKRDSRPPSNGITFPTSNFSTVFDQPESVANNGSHTQSPTLTSALSLHQSLQFGTHSSTEPTADTIDASFDPPPIYGTTEGDRSYRLRPMGSSSLARFANANREMISEDLEARLVAAGYMPADDPDSLTEDEWSQLGITKLELLRLQRLFTRRSTMQPMVLTSQ